MLRLTRTTTIIAALLTGVLAASAPARADDDDDDQEGTEADDDEAPGLTPVASPVAAPNVEIPTELEQDWYGWQVLAADATGLLATIGCVSAVQADECFVPYLIAAPSVHLSHRRPTQALASLGLRVALPLAGALIGLQAASCGEDTYCGLGEVVGGVFIGTLAASLIDAFALSTVVTERPGIVTHSRISFLSPSVSAGPNGASFGLRGNF